VLLLFFLSFIYINACALPLTLSPSFFPTNASIRTLVLAGVLYTPYVFLTDAIRSSLFLNDLKLQTCSVLLRTYIPMPLYPEKLDEEILIIKWY